MTPTGRDQPPDRLAARVLARLAQADATLATAESLTGGLLAASVTSVPGASAHFRGGIIAYATDVKHRLLHVPEELLLAYGAVSAETAEAMAAGVLEELASMYGAATTGVAGPDPQEGKPVGLVYVAVAGPRGTSTRLHRFVGERAAVRADAVGAVLNLLMRELAVDLTGG